MIFLCDFNERKKFLQGIKLKLHKLYPRHVIRGEKVLIYFVFSRFVIFPGLLQKSITYTLQSSSKKEKKGRHLEFSQPVHAALISSGCQIRNRADNVKYGYFVGSQFEIASRRDNPRWLSTRNLSHKYACAASTCTLCGHTRDLLLIYICTLYLNRCVGLMNFQTFSPNLMKGLVRLAGRCKS